MNGFLLVSLMVISCGIILQIIDNEQPQPYMDEVFHVPQVQQYCAYNFTHWDNMITTLPGLYISSILWIIPLESLTGLNFCTIPFLRFQNVIFIVFCFLVIHNLFKRLHPQSPPTTYYLVSLSLVSFPLLFFFSFLYYTDVGSTLLVLLGYSYSLKAHYLTSSMVLFLAVLFRQTNIIWAAFIAGTVGLNIIEGKMVLKGDQGVMKQVVSLLRSIYCSLPSLAIALWSYMLLGFSFCVFVIINGSIVVGDKTHHIASLHFPQFLYFVSFSCVFSISSILTSKVVLKRFLYGLFKPNYIISLVLLTCLSLLMVHYYTYEHPYLLADNRHYTFYIWKNIYRMNDHIKYYLAPLYSLCIIYLVTSLVNRNSVYWVLLFIICCFVSLVPQALLEFRYYIIPYLFYRLHVHPVSVWGSALELLINSIINIITIWLFVNKPFKWQGHEEYQRFMW